MLNREETERLIVEKLIEIQKIMKQFEDNSHRPFCADVFDNAVYVYQYKEGHESRSIDVWRDTNDISD